MNVLRANFPLSILLSVPGELIGIDYLYHQTGRALQDVNPDSEETEEMLEDVAAEEDVEDEGFGDADSDPTIGLVDLSPALSLVDTTSSDSPTLTTSASLLATAGPSGSGSIATLAAPEQQLVIILVTFFYYTTSVDFHFSQDNNFCLSCFPDAFWPVSSPY